MIRFAKTIKTEIERGLALARASRSCWQGCASMKASFLPALRFEHGRDARATRIRAHSPRLANGMVLIVSAVILLCAARPALAEHFEIELTIRASHDQATAHSDTDPPPQGVNPRPVCHAKRGEELTLQFMFSSNFPHGTKKGVGVRYYVAPEKAAGNKSPPDPGKPPVTEGSFTMDFKPDGRVGLRQRLKIDRPGAYLVRVESLQSDSDNEHFAALDLVIE
jgi:hypothetical protein